MIKPLLICFVLLAGSVHAQVSSSSPQKDYVRVTEESLESNTLHYKLVKPGINIYQKTRGIPCKLVELDKTKNILMLYSGNHSLIEVVFTDNKGNFHLYRVKVKTKQQSPEVKPFNPFFPTRPIQ